MEKQPLFSYKLNFFSASIKLPQKSDFPIIEYDSLLKEWTIYEWCRELEEEMLDKNYAARLIWASLPNLGN